VHWCLNKAIRELKETGMHRGLVKTVPDIDMAAKHIAKAEHNFNAAMFFEKSGYSDWSTSAFFYCIYHCFLSILRKFGYESRNQECTIAAIEMLNDEEKISIDAKYINVLKINRLKEEEISAIRIREDFQYGTDTEFTRKDEFNRLSKLCKEIIAKTKEIIFR
jgi:uncharacterized protein (UPF0332 family)